MASPERPTILVVDDDPRVRDVLANALRRADFNVWPAQTGHEALVLLKDEPDLVVLDVKLPDFSGFDVCRVIRDDPATATIPVLMLSGVYLETDDRARALESGADAYLVKPEMSVELIASVRALLRMRMAQRAEAVLRERAVIAALAADVRSALASGEPIPGVLARCAEAFVRQLDVAFARIWTLAPGDDVLHLQASAGLYTHLDGAHSRVKVGELKIGSIAREGRPHLTNDVFADRWVDREWAQREGMVSFAGYPLMVDGRVIGVLAMFARKPLPGTTLEALGLMATEIAECLERKRAEERLQRREAQARFMVEVTRAVTSSLDTDAVLERIVDHASELLSAPRVGLAVIEPDDAGPVLRFVAVRGLSAQFAQRVRPTHWRDGTTAMAIHERRPVWSEDLLTDPAIELTPATRRAVEAEGYHAVLSVPLLAGERVLGALVVYRDEPGPFAPDVVELMQVFASQAAIAIENARLYRRAEDRASNLRALSALTQLMVSASTSGAVFQAVAAAAIELLGARLGRVWVEDPEERVMRLVASAETEGTVPPTVTELPYGTGIVGAVVEGRRPIYGRDIQANPRLSDRRHAEGLGLHAYAALPLIAEGRAVGVLIVVFGETRDFAAEERELMRLLADQAAIAIRQAELYREADRRRQEAEVMAELASKINASLELDVVLTRVAEGARHLCRADGSLIALRTPDDPTIRFRHWVGTRDPRWGEHSIEPGKGVGGRVLATGQVFRTDDYFTDQRVTADYQEMARAEGIIAELAVPIRSRDAVQGVLYVINRSRRPFTDHDEAILRRLADHAGAAIANANLYQGMRAAHEQLAQSQAQLVQNERLRALGEMAAGVAHDFNNMLAVIVGRTELLLGRAHDPYVVRGLEEVRRAATDGAATVRRIQNFTGTRRARAAGRVALLDVVEEVIELTRVRWQDDAQRRGVQYEVTVEGAVPVIAGQSDELREIFTNLLNNALDAMPTGGRCTFRLGVDGSAATVVVEDTGVGMPPDVRARIFEPFFTTKGPKGSGLGLAVTWGIVTSNGGTIAVESAPGAGTRMIVRLPIPPTLPAEPGAYTTALAATAARILVIDDEEPVRQVLSEMLSEAGHAVAQAENGTAALALCAAQRFDLVISDLSMPGMSGWEVAAAVRARHPGVLIGLVTGWGEQVDPGQAERHHLKFVLAKPFMLTDVLAAVTGALDG